MEMSEFLETVATMLSDGKVLFGAFIITVCVVTIIIVFKTQGFFELLCKAIGMILQQLCSIVLEAIFLVIKLISAVEVYLVLLIDALTGKASSNGKIASLAIGVLSIASYYTTYSGMCLFVENEHIVMLITLGIQAILLATSLRIGDNLTMKDEDRGGFAHGKSILVSSVGCVLACVAAYILGITDFSFAIKEKVYNIFYIVAIGTAIFAVISLIRGLVEAECKNFRLGIILFAVYIAVLSISSFYSYNEFVTVMYPNQIREIDTFVEYKTKVLETLEKMRSSVDTEYYENIGFLLENDLRDKAEQLDSIDWSTTLSQKELEIYNRSNEFEEYLANSEKFANKDQLKEECKEEYEEKVRLILDNCGGLGPNTLAALNNAQAEYKQKLAEIDAISVNNVDVYIIQNVDLYTALKEKMSNVANNYSDSVKIALLYLQEEQLDQAELQKLENAVKLIANDASKYLNANDVNNNLKTMLNVYREYVDFNYTYEDNVKKILGIESDDAMYDEERNEIKDMAQEIIISIPATQYVFRNQDGSEVSTEFLDMSEYHHEIELYFRNSDSNLNIIEKNIRTFIGNKLIGITCALLAVLIDMMILFVGLIIPKDIDFWDENQYSKTDKRKILSNIFNKPIKR